MICIPCVGCIPTEVVLGALLVLLKPIYDYFLKFFYGNDAASLKINEVNNVPNTPTAAAAVVESFDHEDSPYILKADDNFKLRLDMTKKVVVLRFTQSACKPWYAITIFMCI